MLDAIYADIVAASVLDAVLHSVPAGFPGVVGLGHHSGTGIGAVVNWRGIIVDLPTGVFVISRHIFSFHDGLFQKLIGI
jgi:hypothetical protein